MSYVPLIDAQLKLAFRTAKDLAIPAVFEKTIASDFDFNSATVTAEIKPVTTQIIVFDGKKDSSKSNSESKQFMVKAKDIGDVKMYDKVTFDSKEWTIVQAIKGTGFILVIEVTREG